MKIQDIIFLIVLALLFYKFNPKYFVIAGLICLALAIPLFQLWVFFSAERLIYYGFAFILASVAIYLIPRRP